MLSKKWRTHSSPSRLSLNPCFAGICSQSEIKNCENYRNQTVLILVLLEYALKAGVESIMNPSVALVLILVLLEYALKGHGCGGQWS